MKSDRTADAKVREPAGLAHCVDRALRQRQKLAGFPAAEDRRQVSSVIRLMVSTPLGQGSPAIWEIFRNRQESKKGNSPRSGSQRAEQRINAAIQRAEVFVGELEHEGGEHGQHVAARSVVDVAAGAVC